MGQVIPRNSSPERIFGDTHTTLSNARSRSDAIKSAAEARLGPIEVAIFTNEENFRAAKTAARVASSRLEAADASSDLTVGRVIDVAWNELGRPSHSVDFTCIVGGGKQDWTDGDPLDQHLRMSVLADRFRKTTVPALQANKEAWAVEIEQKAAVQEAAAAASKAADAPVYSFVAQQRSLANIAQVALTRLKRDYKSSGMTEVQIHELIPDYTPRSAKRAVPATAAPAGGTPTP